MTMSEHLTAPGKRECRMDLAEDEWKVKANWQHADVSLAGAMLLLILDGSLLYAMAKSKPAKLQPGTQMCNSKGLLDTLADRNLVHKQPWPRGGSGKIFGVIAIRSKYSGWAFPLIMREKGDARLLVLQVAWGGRLRSCGDGSKGAKEELL